MKLTYRRGFTIVEILIVIVVIGILATIILVSYNGVQQRTATTSLQHEISQAVSKLESSRSTDNSEAYPTPDEAGVNSSTLTYYYDPSNTNNSYCVEAKKGGLSFSATNGDTQIYSGDCSERGLISWWQFNNSPNDSGANGINGSITGSVTGTTGQDGQANHAYSFSSASTMYFSASNNALVNDTQTFSMWVRPSNWSSATASTFLTKRSGASNGFFIAYYNATSTLLFDCGGSNAGNRWTTNYAPPLNQWTYLVFTCSTKTGVALYVNGTFNSSRTTVDRSSTTTSPTKIGYDGVSSPLSFNGAVDDVRLYNRILSASEITGMFTNGAK